MSKTSYAAMSLIAALPAMFLCYLLTMAFLSHADKMPVLLSAVAGLTLLLSSAVAVTPVGIMLGGGKKAPKGSKKAAKAASPAAAAPAAQAAENLDVEDNESAEDKWTDSADLDEELSDEWDAEADEALSEEASFEEASFDEVSDDNLSDSEFMASEDFEAVETNEFVPSEEAVDTLKFDSDELDAAISDDFEFDEDLSDEFDVDFDFDDDEKLK